MGYDDRSVVKEITTVIIEDMQTDEYMEFITSLLDELEIGEVEEVLSKTEHRFNVEDQDIDVLTARILKWHYDRKITVNGNSSTQVIKLGEEFGELCSAIVRGEPDIVKDSLGDMYVVMVAIAELEQMDLSDCIQHAFDEIKDRTGHLNEMGNFIKEE